MASCSSCAMHTTIGPPGACREEREREGEREREREREVERERVGVGMCLKEVCVKVRVNVLARCVYSVHVHA